jgi:CRISPR-associated protein Cpf1
MKTLNNFTNKYPLSKTLRFELIPQGETLANIHKKGLLTQDENRAEKYKLAKKIIDDYHKYFINKALEGLSLPLLNEYFELYKSDKKDETIKKQFEDLQGKFRKQIADRFSKHPNPEISIKFKNIFAKELIKIDLLDFVKTEEEMLIVKEFENFTTYFTGFHENRANMYSAEDKSTAIAFRLIHQNLPKFIDNKGIFKKVLESPIKEKFNQILAGLEFIIQVKNIEEYFEIDFFNETLTQTGIDKYNTLIGGKTEEGGKVKIQGLNEYINLYNQTVKDKRDKIAKLKPLFKQILSDRNAISWLPEEFESDIQLLESLEKLYQELKQLVFSNNEDPISLTSLLQHLKDYDLSKIYIQNDKGIADLSQGMIGNWNAISQSIIADYDAKYKGKNQIGTEKYETERSKYLKRFDSFSIQFLNNCLLNHKDELKIKNISNYFSLAGGESEKNIPNLFAQVIHKYSLLEEIIKTFDVNSNLSHNQSSVDKIKVFLDSIKAIQYFVKPLLGKGNEADKDEKFYSELDRLWQLLDQVTPLYNMVRNRLTRKPYSTSKIKLNFENSTLLDGWDLNKEEANTSILFVKDENYFLGIMDKKHNKVFREIPKTTSNSNFQKINYKLLPGASKMLPKVFFSASNIKHFAPTNDILKIRNHGSHTKNGKPQEGFEKLDFSVNDCRTIIDFFKSSINKHEEWKNFNFEFKPTQQYETIDEFYREVENQGYSISYTHIDENYINKLIAEGKLYLFQIYNKDFSLNSKGTPNLHTIYWKMLFNENNLKNVVYKLNGQAEIFYRKGSIKPQNTIIHKANQTINNKNELNKKKQSLFSYDLVKDKRYTTDKFQFHVPITMNFKANGGGSLNNEVNIFIQENGISHIIGIDRGERHLLYLSVIDLKGNIKEQFSLNEIVNNYNEQEYKTNYFNLLNNKEKHRDEARKNWKDIETIKELKEGYLSQVIHKITELMVQYNAIVVLEDLNLGFMRGRQKVEKQVYQKFEKMLIDKLNYFVDKKKNITENGGALKALQLTNKFESFQKMGKQSGFLFYIPAWNTSKIDPVTGFINLFQIKYESIDKAKQFFALFQNIGYNDMENYFEFKFDYSQFSNKVEGIRTNWTICTQGTRIRTFRNISKNNEWDNEEINLTQSFELLFDKFEIPYNGVNIKSNIIAQVEKSFFEELIFLFKLTLQMRNSFTNSDIDYLISPVANENGEFYDSRKELEKGKDERGKYKSKLPIDADANGAYNIARKGLILVNRIKDIGVEKFEKTKRVDKDGKSQWLNNKEWLVFVQNKK